MYDFVLINPPSPFLEDQLVMPPLGIMTLSSYLKSKGFTVAIHDMSNNESEYNYRIPIARYSCFTATTPQYPLALRILEIMKQNIEYSRTTYVIGGSHASCFQNCLKDGFDVINIGEGEKSLHKLGMCNLRVRNLIMTGHQIEDLNSLPLPDRSWPGFKKYKYTFEGFKFTTSMTSRGCPYKCGFCYNMFGRNVRYLTVESVIREARILKNMGFEGIMYYDDTFTSDKKRSIEIAHGLKELDMKFRLFIRANTVDFDMIKEFKECGCLEVGMGVESGSQKILNNISKGTTVNMNKNVIKMCKDNGLNIKIFLIIGLPGENKESIEETKRFIKESMPNGFDITIYTPFPNTPIWDSHASNIETDIIFTNNIDYNKMFYKSTKGSYKSNVRTYSLTYEDIENARDEIESLKTEISLV